MLMLFIINSYSQESIKDSISIEGIKFNILITNYGTEYVECNLEQVYLGKITDYNAYYKGKIFPIRFKEDKYFILVKDNNGQQYAKCLNRKI
jgi:hypothetical protein